MCHWRSHLWPPAATLLLLLAACGDSRTSNVGLIYTLYRNSVTDANMRLHVATFDANQKEEYNSGNCEQARELFQGQPGVKTKFWCEKGAFRK